MRRTLRIKMGSFPGHRVTTTNFLLLLVIRRINGGDFLAALDGRV